MKHPEGAIEERAERLASEAKITLVEALKEIGHDLECEAAAMALLRERPTVNQGR